MPAHTLQSLTNFSPISHQSFTAQCIRRIDVAARFIRWSDSGDLVAIVSDTSFFVLSFNRQLVEEVVESGAAMDEDGIDDAFELEHEIPETVRTGAWVRMV